MKIVSARAIRRKIRAVGNIKKITRAMEMVSAAKLKKVLSRLMAIRPYASKIQELMGNLMAGVGETDYRHLKQPEQVKNVAVVVLSSDKGLCGSYNTNLFRMANGFLNAEKAPSVKLLTIGRKARDFYKRERWPVMGSHLGLPVEPTFGQIREILRDLTAAFEKGEIDVIQIAFTEFVNAVRYTPKVIQFLPITGPRVSEREKKKSHAEAAGRSKTAAPEYIYEPEPKKILGTLIPRYVEITFYSILLETMASEHAARMSAMRNASDNAQELIDDLTLVYNKARQSSITKELLDIVGGAEALKG